MDYLFSYNLKFALISIEDIVGILRNFYGFVLKPGTSALAKNPNVLYSYKIKNSIHHQFSHLLIKLAKR